MSHAPYLHIAHYQSAGPLTAQALACHPEWHASCVVCVDNLVPGVQFAMIPIEDDRGRMYVRPAHWDCVIIRIAASAGLLRAPAES